MEAAVPQWSLQSMPEKMKLNKVGSGYPVIGFGSSNTEIGELYEVPVSPSALIAVWRYWFRLSRLSIMVIGSFASYAKTKSVESAV
jgi:hypothetical protein